MDNYDSILEEMINEIKKLRNIDDVTKESTLSDIGIDSLNIIELILICEQKYPDVKNPESIEVDQFTTIQKLHEQMIELSK